MARVPRDADSRADGKGGTGCPAGCLVDGVDASRDPRQGVRLPPQLLLRAGILYGTTQAILLYVLYNVVYAAHAFPAGILSDRVGRKPVVLIGYGAFIAMSTLLVLSGDLLVLVAAFILYGLSYGMAEGTQRALVADFAPPDIKATVLGAYHTSIGIVRLASGVVAGLLWVVFMPQATFAFGAIAATVATIGLFLWKPPAKS
ncbi:MAG: MFS transporter [Methanobacteriota archaeon]|nr:MAG: MFS transporter [Euryarchaeota archaeon]